MEWLTDFDFWELSANNSAEQKKHFSKLNLLVKLQYIKKGSQNKYNNGKTVTKLNYIEIPLYALYQSRLSSGGRIFGGIGPYAGYSIDGKIKSTNNGQTTSINAFTQAGGFKRFDAGLALIAGYKTPNDIGLSLGYEFGLANVAIANAGGDKIKNRGFSFNVSYSLDKIIEGSKK
ncbi:MAG TPA: porin family protein [Chitinophagaceae bacterium]|nr:porin family protein [Chitinophagaceae bacterium]